MTSNRLANTSTFLPIMDFTWFQALKNVDAQSMF